MLTKLKSRVVAVLAVPGRAQRAQLEARLDNLEHAHHRDLEALRAQIDERAFAMAQLTIRSVEIALTARLQAATAATAATVDAALDAAREHTDAATAATLDAALDAAREHTDAATAATLDAARKHTDGSMAVATRRNEEVFGHLRTEIARLGRRAQREDGIVEGIGSRSPQSYLSSLDAQGPPPRVDDLLYLAIEDRFRGDPVEIRMRQEQYLPLLPDVIDEAHPLLDLGAGRGEWLGVLSEHGVPARGVDSNLSCVDECRAAGLRADVGDLLDVLRSSEDHSYGAITMFHVVEHLPFGVLADVLTECARVLVPGGILVAETPNALNLRVAATNFWLDPTHVRPLHPELLRLLGERAGFARMEDLFLHDLGDPIGVSLGDARVDGWLSDLSRSLDGPGDYAMLAWTGIGDD